VVKRKTMKDRFSRTLRRISMWCRANRHLPIKEQHTALARKLRHHGQRPCARSTPPMRAAYLAEVAQPALVEGPDDVDTHEPTACGLSAAAGSCRPFHLSRSEPVTRRTGCGKSARPGPWEPRGSNPLGPPGLRQGKLG
jgi:hypothetical protein